MDNIRKYIQNIYEQNRRQKNGYQYTVPSPDSYPYQWLWDSCIHAITLAHFDIEAAKAELRALVSKQFENGLIPHIIYWEEKEEVLNIDWGVEGTSSLTQPPIIAYAVQCVFRHGSDIAFLREMYPYLARYYHHLLTRDPREHHLVGLINPDESGEDNSPRFDAALGLPPDHTFEENNEKRFALFKQNETCNFQAATCMRNFFWVKDVAFSSYMVENLECLSKLAHALGEEEDNAYFYGEAQLMKKAMDKYMYQDGIYWTICGPDHEKVIVKTWAMFAPMAAGISTETDAENLVRNHLSNEKEFASAFPVPTTAMDEVAFRVETSTELPAWLQPNWRGPVWMVPNWIVYRGLCRYGYQTEAEQVKERTIAMIEQSGCREYYHPRTGEGMGAHNFTWGGLIFDMNQQSI